MRNKKLQNVELLSSVEQAAAENLHIPNPNVKDKNHMRMKDFSGTKYGFQLESHYIQHNTTL